MRGSDRGLHPSTDVGVAEETAHVILRFNEKGGASLSACSINLKAPSHSKCSTCLFPKKTTKKKPTSAWLHQCGAVPIHVKKVFRQSENVANHYFEFVDKHLVGGLFGRCPSSWRWRVCVCVCFL